jgi:hypothetical protein
MYSSAASTQIDDLIWQYHFYNVSCKINGLQGFKIDSKLIGALTQIDSTK